MLSGPFRGLEYAVEGRLIPTHKLLGTYEKELWPVIDEIATRDYHTIIDIGAAEGYYVVGFARLMQNVRVVAYGTQLKFHSLIEDLALKNGVLERIEVRGVCDSSCLKSILDNGKGTLVICDIEGAEEDVLDPVAVVALRQTDILSEVHEHLAPGVTEMLRSRFSETHHVDEILSTPRGVDDCPDVVQLPADLALQAMDEMRSKQSKWFWMTRLLAQA